MSIRWRVTGELLCGAKSEPKDDDSYIDDGLHYQLSVILGVLVPDENEAENGIWHWSDKIDIAIKNERKRCAEIARKYAEENRKASIKYAKKAKLLENDIFGHGQIMYEASVELDAAMREALAIASVIESQ